MKKLTIALIAGLVSLNASAGGNVANGEKLAKQYNCAACHGADFNTPIDPSYPKLAGQHADYIAHALAAYKRGNAMNGRTNPIMGAQAQPLSAQDMKDIGAYMASLPSSLVLKR